MSKSKGRESQQEINLSVSGFFQTNERSLNRVEFKYSALAIFLLVLTLTNIGMAQQNKDSTGLYSDSTEKIFTQSFNMCPGGILFGVYSFNYEYLVAQTHGIVGRIDYESVSETLNDDKMDASGYGFTLNYRWHWSQKMGSFFLGSYLRYKIYDGNATSDLEEFDFTLREATLGLNIGKRWVWNSGINITAAFGYGFAYLTKSTEPSSSSIDTTLDKFIDEYDFIGPFYGEISIGYTF